MKPLEKLIVTQPFGSRPEYYAQFGLKGHEGTDFKTKGIGGSFWNNLMGYQPALAVRDGICTAHYGHPYYGTYVELIDNDGNEFRYCHLRNARPPSPESTIPSKDLMYRVKAGEVLGVTGNSGNSTSAHLHLMFRPKNFNVNNGYFGYEDFMRLYPTKFTMQFTTFNADPIICEKTRQLLIQYSNGKLDCTFKRQTIFPELFYSGRMNSENQVAFVKKYPISTPFAYVVYNSDTPNYDFMSGGSVPGTNILLTAGEPNPTPFNLCYEFAHQIQFYLMMKGYPVGLPDDVFTPDDNFLKAKFAHIMPFVEKLIQNGGDI